MADQSEDDTYNERVRAVTFQAGILGVSSVLNMACDAECQDDYAQLDRDSLAQRSRCHLVDTTVSTAHDVEVRKTSIHTQRRVTMRKLLLVGPALALALSMGIPGHVMAAGNSQNPCVGTFASSAAGPGYGQVVSGFAHAGIIGDFASDLATSCNPA
jgi:hypothetical protein